MALYEDNDNNKLPVYEPPVYEQAPPPIYEDAVAPSAINLDKAPEPPPEYGSIHIDLEKAPSYDGGHEINLAKDPEDTFQNPLKQGAVPPDGDAPPEYK
jgi:hypothetical protein